MSGSTFPQSRIFIGFSTANTSTTLSSTLYDIDLINQDLSNAFNTRIGERVMRPNWGCAIWDYFMEQMTPQLHSQIVEEATRICETDVRLDIQSVQVFDVPNGIVVQILLYYKPYNVYNTFSTTFENNQAVYFGQTKSQ